MSDPHEEVAARIAAALDALGDVLAEGGMDSFVVGLVARQKPDDGGHSTVYLRTEVEPRTRELVMASHVVKMSLQVASEVMPKPNDPVVGAVLGAGNGTIQ